jgi:hypothetical protein
MLTPGDAAVRKKRFRDLASTDLLIRHCIKDSHGNAREVFEVGKVKQMVTYLDWMERCLKRLAKTKAHPIVKQRILGRQHAWLTREATVLWHVIRNIDKAPTEVTNGRRLNPYLRLGVHLARKWEPRLRPFSNGRGGLRVSEDYPARIISHIASVVRRVIGSRRFLSWRTNHGRGAIERYRSCSNYMLSIFAVCARPLILRVDLFLAGLAKEIADSPELGQAYDKFLRNLSAGSIIPGVIGYIGREEDGLDRRVHWHVLCVLDGSEHQQAYNFTEELGRYWVENCVGSSALASFKNCYERKDEYEYNCLGLLHYTDSRMLMGLRVALEYMCKDGAQFLVKDGKDRSLRKGLAPPPPEPGRARGAPRKRGNDLSVAELVLRTKARRVD